MELQFQLIADADPTGLDSVFARFWPAYRRWMRQAVEQDLPRCLDQLAEHMPELLPVFQRLHKRFGGTDEIGRFLTLYNPPRVVRACTQAILDSADGSVLLRTYDHSPKLIDGVILRSNWLNTPTLTMTDCLWGALDGINGHGLSIALAFGGRNVSGDGFAAPLICRYVLETCADIKQARAALARLPVYMPYTFAVLDSSGDFVTAFLGPDAEPVFVTRRASANHQGRIEWPEYARFVKTAERQECAEALIDPGVSLEQARDAFLAPPIWRTEYQKASGTLYASEYTPATRSLTLHWPGRKEQISLGETEGRRFAVSLLNPAVK